MALHERKTHQLAATSTHAARPPYSITQPNPFAKAALATSVAIVVPWPGRANTAVLPAEILCASNLSCPSSNEPDSWLRREDRIPSTRIDRKSTRLNSSHITISYAV